ncbi:MAG TPA: hypothetical protein VMH89_02715 [Candidatus Acidoferrum sp.]|nr:hypothetical protein [Candidatus Acidoferrum sp.]
MSIEKKSLISTLKTTKKANVASSPAPLTPEASQVINKRARVINKRARVINKRARVINKKHKV